MENTLNELQVVAAKNMSSTLNSLKTIFKTTEENIDTAVITGLCGSYNLNSIVKGHLSCKASIEFLEQKFKKFIGITHDEYLEMMKPVEEPIQKP